MYPQPIQQLINHNSVAAADAQITNGSLIFVDVAAQKITLFRQFEPQLNYSVSTSKHGCGNKENSFCTPLGLHEIAKKIGANAPSGEIFIGRQAQGRCYENSDVEQGRDIISSRIMWLRGLQSGFNSGGDCDSFERYIYIHGTAYEIDIGKPASIGCVRMRNADVIELFECVEIGERVLIHQN